MTWQQWVLVAYMALQILRVVYMVDRPREPTTLGDAIFGLLEFGAAIWLIVSIA